MPRMRPKCVMPNCDNTGLIRPVPLDPNDRDTLFLGCIVCTSHSRGQIQDLGKSDMERVKEWVKYFEKAPKVGEVGECTVRGCIEEACISKSINDYNAHCGNHCEPGHFNVEDFDIDPERVTVIKARNLECQYEWLKDRVKKFLSEPPTSLYSQSVRVAELWELVTDE